MSHDLELYHQILFIDRPWMETTATEARYQQLLHELSIENFAQQPLYGMSFLKPLTYKRKYYHAIITNEAIRFLNSVHNLIWGALNENEKKFHIHTILSKKLPAKLHETEKIISARGFYFMLINDTSIDKKLREDAFIIQNLKYQLIHLYLEIQDTFSIHLNEGNLTEEEIHSVYFNEPFQTFIKSNPRINQDSIRTTKVETKKFKAIKADFRPGIQKGILSYEEIISDPQSFANAEEELYSIELIDENYDFTNKHTEKQKLAAIYHVLIRKGYFRKRNFTKLKNIKEVDIRKFLDHRYNCNVDAQFRSWKNNPDGLASYLKSFPLINNLPHS